jgi:P-type E1-E2 ATPase
VLAFSVAAAFVGDYVVAASLGGALGLLNFYLVTKTEERSKCSIVDLLGGQVRNAWLLVDGVEVETPIGVVSAGDTVVVHAGQMIPVDGVIASGTATIDQQMLTGESPNPWKVNKAQDN